MKKILSALLVFGFLLLPANAGMINSDSDVKAKLLQINRLLNTDLSSMVNKGDMIGEKAANFQITTAQYKQMTKVSADAIRSQLSEIEIIRNSQDYSDSEKTAMIRKLYLDIETNVYNIDSQSLSYLMNLRRVMPSITYQKYVKSFQEFYNSIGLTPNKMDYQAVQKL